LKLTLFALLGGLSGVGVSQLTTLCCNGEQAGLAKTLKSKTSLMCSFKIVEIANLGTRFYLVSAISLLNELFLFSGLVYVAAPWFGD